MKARIFKAALRQLQNERDAFIKNYKVGQCSTLGPLHRIEADIKSLARIIHVADDTPVYFGDFDCVTPVDSVDVGYYEGPEIGPGDFNTWVRADDPDPEVRPNAVIIC